MTNNFNNECTKDIITNNVYVGKNITNLKTIYGL